MNIQAAVVRQKSGPFVIEDIQLDEPRADEVIVRVVSAGICHTDFIPEGAGHSRSIPRRLRARRRRRRRKGGLAGRRS